jgi:hypothetical protein
MSLEFEESAYFRSQEMCLDDAIGELSSPECNDVFSYVNRMAAKIVIVTHLELLDSLWAVLRDYSKDEKQNDDSFISDCLDAYPALKNLL